MKKTKFDVKTIKRVLKYLKRYRVMLFFSLLFAALNVALTLYVPLLTGEAIDLMLGKGLVNWDGIYTIILQIAVCTGISALCQWLMNVINNRITYGMVRKLRRDAFAKFQKLPLSYLDSHSVGEIVSRLMTDVEQFTDGLLMGFAQFFTGILTILGTLVIMLVNGSVGTGVAVMGAFSLVRFRSVAGSAKEIVSIFLAMATGLATAMGYIGLAVCFVVIICIVMIIASLVHLKEKDDLVRDLKITVPEDLNYAHEFDDLFDEYTHNSKLLSVKTSNMCSLYKLIYRIELIHEDDVQKFIDELRCRNGNLEIAVMMPAVEEARL